MIILLIDFEIVNFGDDQKKIFSQKEVRIDFNTQYRRRNFFRLKKIFRLKLKTNQIFQYHRLKTCPN